MPLNFWQKLNKPIYALAPMAGFTDSAFRQSCKQFGANVVYSEMASATALAYNPIKTLGILTSSKKERPYIIQLFGSNPKHFTLAVKLLTNKNELSRFPMPNYLVPNGFDINFGCPVKKVRKQRAGAVLMNNVKLAREIIKAVSDNTDLPVSIKIRSKVEDINALKFLESVAGLNIKAVMIHGRTLAQGHSGDVDWQIIKQARPLVKGVLLANGGVKDRASAQELLEKTGADGLGIGRGALGRPWIFMMSETLINTVAADSTDVKLIFKIALGHAKLAYKLKGEQGIIEMRKHLCFYVQGMPGAREIRQQIVGVKNLEDIKKIIK